MGPREENATYPSNLPKLFHMSPYLKSSLVTNHLRVFKRLSSYGAVTPFCSTGLGPEVKSMFLNLRMRKLSPGERTGREWISDGAQGSRGPLLQAEANPAAQEFWSIPQSFTKAMLHVRLRLQGKSVGEATPTQGFPSLWDRNQNNSRVCSDRDPHGRSHSTNTPGYLSCAQVLVVRILQA